MAIKGVGGYHLACDAANRAAIIALRERKFRKEKPFALMARDLAAARRIAALTAEHERLLVDRAKPIVLAPSRATAGREIVFDAISPETDDLGVMLPYAPLHYLLFAAGAPSVLVMTSGNRSSEPIAFDDLDARERLSGIADALLRGQRPIARRVEDSVVMVRDGQMTLVRRARGYAPAAVCRLESDRPVLALGADLKSAVALVIDGEALVGPHLGDLDDAGAFAAFERSVADLLAMAELRPQDLVVAHDMHPQYRSSRHARGLAAARLVAVQHHEAHVASVMAEHGLLDERVVGVVFDGAGYGRDGAIWGGEFFVGSVSRGLERVAWLRPTPMPGGDAAARFPAQAAAGFVADAAACAESWPSDLPLAEAIAGPPFGLPRRFANALAIARKRVRCFPTSSVGRLFDAVAALLGFTRPISFEGQAAIWLEQRARGIGPQSSYPFSELDPRRLVAAVVRDRIAGRDVGEIAAAFHQTLARGAANRARDLCRSHGTRVVAVSGGVWQNELLWRAFMEYFADDREISIIANQSVPLGDGGIALGQAALAAASLRATDTT